MCDTLTTMDAGCQTKCGFSVTCNCCNIPYTCLCNLHSHMVSNSCVKQYLVDLVTAKVNVILHTESDSVSVDQKVSCIVEVHTSAVVESNNDNGQQNNDIDKQESDLDDGDDDDDIAEEDYDEDDDEQDVDDAAGNQDPQLIKREKPCRKSIDQSTVTDDDTVLKFVCSPSDKGHKVKRQRLSYDRENLQKAFQATQEGMSVYRAAREYSVPESTLRDRTRGLVDIDVKPGPELLFSVDEEERLVNHINYLAGIGYKYTVSNMRYLAKDYGDSLLKNVKAKEALSNQWYYGFSKRWPDLMVGNPHKQPATKAQLKNYCKEFASVLTGNNLRDKPQNIYTIDETSIPSEHSPPKSVRNRNKTPEKDTPSTVTILAAGNALGNSIPPYYVFPGQRWNPELLRDACPGADGEVTETGWSDYSVFHNYLTHHFTKHVKLTEKSSTPTLILYDGHKSHVSLTLMEWARKHNVILFVLPPHSKHVTQPLELSVFGTVQSMYYAECQAFKRRNPRKGITKFQIAGFTAKPYLKAMSATNLTSAFRSTGVYPFDDKAIVSPKVAPSKMYLHEGSDQESSQEN